jgi:hypothetical protein
MTEGESFYESTVSKILNEVQDSGEDFIIILHHGRTDDLHELIDKTLRESELFQNVIEIQSVIVT